MYNWKVNGITLHRIVNRHCVNAMLNAKILDINNPSDYAIMSELDKVIAGLEQRNTLRPHRSEVIEVKIKCVTNHWTRSSRKASDIIRIFKRFGFKEEKNTLGWSIGDTITFDAANY